MEPEAEIIRAQLFALQDETYRTFHSALMPTVPPETVIGVRVPALRRLAKQLAGTAQAEVFLQALPHGYYEENNLHAFLIELIRDYDRALAETEAFLPYINNWATCDCFCPKVFAKHKTELLVPIRRWLDSGEAYTVRYGMEMLMRYYLDDAFRPEYLEWVADVRSTELLYQYDAGMVFCHSTGKAAGCRAAVAHRKAAGSVDPQQSHPESGGKPPHSARNEAAAARSAQPFIKASGFPRRFPVYFIQVLL